MPAPSHVFNGFIGVRNLDRASPRISFSTIRSTDPVISQSHIPHINVPWGKIYHKIIEVLKK